MLIEWQAHFISHYISLAIALSDLGVRDWAAIISIGWVLYQLIERRRVSETNIDKYLERHFTDKNKSVVEQRRTYLAHLSAVASSWAVVRIARLVLANVLRGLWFAWRILKLDLRHTSARRAMLLFDSGSSDAQAEFKKVAQNLLDTAKNYRKQALLKREEAINAYIFAGRIAAIEGDSAATIDAFSEAIEIKDGDYDARKFIGEQFCEVGNLSGALREFKKLSTLTVTRRSLALSAEALRLQAGVLIRQGDVEAACAALNDSLDIENGRRDIAGLAATQHLLGDAHRRGGDLGTAALWYRQSADSYTVVDDKRMVKQVQRKLWRLQPEETFLSRAVTALGTFLIERVAKQLRAPAQMP